MNSTATSSTNGNCYFKGGISKKVGFEVLMTVNVNIIVSWDVAPCRLIYFFRR
jgi:hypothetical protein